MTRQWWLLAATAVMAVGCGGDSGPGTDPWSPAGAWRASKWEFTEIANPSNRYDVVGNGATMRLVLTAAKTVTMSLSWMGVDLSETGTWTYAGGVLTIALGGETMVFTPATDHSRLDLVEAHAGFDFNHDGQDEDAHVNRTMVREP